MSGEVWNSSKKGLLLIIIDINAILININSIITNINAIIINAIPINATIINASLHDVCQQSDDPLQEKVEEKVYY